MTTASGSNPDDFEGTGDEIIDRFDVPLPADELIGVRVTLIHTDPRGIQRVASVVFNAQQGVLVGDILAQALEWANGGAMAQHTGNASPGVYGDPQIAQVVAGGYPGAVLTIAEG